MESPGQSSTSSVQTVRTRVVYSERMRNPGRGSCCQRRRRNVAPFYFPLSLPLSTCVRIGVSVPKWGTDPALIGLGSEQARPASLSSVGHGKAMVLQWIVHAVYSLDTCFRTALSGLMWVCVFSGKITGSCPLHLSVLTWPLQHAFLGSLRPTRHLSLQLRSYGLSQESENWEEKTEGTRGVVLLGNTVTMLLNLSSPPLPHSGFKICILSSRWLTLIFADSAKALV